MKPRIVLVRWAWDCGFKYEEWHCFGKNVRGMGGNPKEAYNNWLKEGKKLYAHQP